MEWRVVESSGVGRSNGERNGVVWKSVEWSGLACCLWRAVNVFPVVFEPMLTSMRPGRVRLSGAGSCQKSVSVLEKNALFYTTNVIKHKLLSAALVLLAFYLQNLRRSVARHSQLVPVTCKAFIQIHLRHLAEPVQLHLCGKMWPACSYFYRTGRDRPWLWGSTREKKVVCRHRSVCSAT